MSAWTPACMCRCGRPLLEDPWQCVACARAYDSGDGVLRWLSEAGGAAREPFMSQYRAIRERDGYRQPSPDYYRALPDVPADDPQFVVWQVRRESFARLRQLLLSRFRGGAPAVLDLGAGNGWLSRRLAEAGCRPVAVDVFDDERDGLGACRHYDIAFPRVLADFDDLPFAVRQFDAVIFNGSIHYSPDVSATLTHAGALLAPGGVIAVVDSPAFMCDADGDAMCTRNRERFRRDYGVASPEQPGEGYVTLPGLNDAAVALGLQPHFFESRGPWRWAAGRFLTRVRHGLVPPKFGVWMAA
ncbi:MAG TPA: methyltransferase domain-containing protein [Vicinamibacterales bacterium]|nr:methyltransferase domain-containing protein [Vicinamibacterales bacterium]